MDEAEELDRLSEKIIAAAIYVHSMLGPGLMESVYETCLMHVLCKQGLRVEKQKELPVVFDQIRLDCGYRLDLLVEKRIVVEVKAIESIQPIHRAQLLSYLRLSKCKVGLLINFNVILLRQGITRVVNGFPDKFSRRTRR